MPTPAVPDFFATDVRGSRRFYRDLGKHDREAVTVVAGGWEACAPGYRVDRKDFPHLSVEWVAEGRGSLQLGGRQFELRPGSLFTYGPGVSQVITCHPEDPLRKYFVDFRGRRARAVLEEAGLSPGYCGVMSRAVGVLAVWEELIRFGARAHPSAAQGAARALALLVTLLADDRVGPDGPGRAEATLERCEAYMQANFLTVRTVEDVAAACGVEAAYLCRLFRRFRAQTPFDHLQRLQMGWAAIRLQEPGRLVREVADALSLDPFQFSRTFKRIQGVSPRDFQSLYRR